jgi:hypothetical protein
MKREQFLEGVNNDTDHRILLWEAMRLAPNGGNVIEFGSGHGSTPFLRDHCKVAGRDFESYEHNPEWADKTGATLVPNTDWESLNISSASVLFIDHAPGERRQLDIVKYANTAQIIVVHDTETGQADAGYKCRQHFKNFKYCVEVKTNGAWATMLSNFIDLSSCVGVTWKDYTITAYTG